MLILANRQRMHICTPHHQNTHPQSSLGDIVSNKGGSPGSYQGFWFNNCFWFLVEF